MTNSQRNFNLAASLAGVVVAAVMTTVAPAMAARGNDTPGSDAGGGRCGSNGTPCSEKPAGDTTLKQQTGVEVGVGVGVENVNDVRNRNDLEFKPALGQTTEIEFNPTIGAEGGQGGQGGHAYGYGFGEGGQGGNSDADASARARTGDSTSRVNLNQNFEGDEAAAAAAFAPSVNSSTGVLCGRTIGLSGGVGTVEVTASAGVSLPFGVNQTCMTHERATEIMGAGKEIYNQSPAGGADLIAVGVGTMAQEDEAVAAAVDFVAAQNCMDGNPINRFRENCGIANVPVTAQFAPTIRPKP